MRRGSEHPRRAWARRAGLALAAVLLAGRAAADERRLEGHWEGRWEGQAQIPGAPMPLVIDLARGPGGVWIGSVILPGRGVKGAPLAQVVVGAAGMRGSLADATPAINGPVPELRLGRRDDGRLVGELRQGALVAPVELARTGAAQVDRPVPATALSPALLGTWVGRYELGGTPREVTLTLANGASGLGGGTLLIVGKRRSELVVDHVVQGSAMVTLSVRAAALRIEGRHGDGTISGRLVQGPFEAALVLRRPAQVQS